MGKKIAMLVTATFTTRVIVDDTDLEEQILEKAANKIRNAVATDFNENVESIRMDIECPYGTFVDESIQP